MSTLGTLEGNDASTMVRTAQNGQGLKSDAPQGVTKNKGFFSNGELGEQRIKHGVGTYVCQLFKEAEPMPR